MKPTIIGILVVLLLLISDAAGDPLLPGGNFEIHWEGAEIKLPAKAWIYETQKRTFPPALVEALIREGGFTDADKQPPDKLEPGTWLRELEDPDLLFYERETIYDRWAPQRQLSISPRAGWIDYRNEETTPPRKPLEEASDWKTVVEKTMAWLELAGITSEGLLHKDGSKELFAETNTVMTSRHNPRTGETFGPLATERILAYSRTLDGLTFTGPPVIRSQYASKGQLSRLEIVWKNYVRQREITLPNTNQITAQLHEGKAKMILWGYEPPKAESVRILRCSVAYQGLLGRESTGTLRPGIHLTTEIVAGGKTNQCFLRLVPD